MNLPSIPRSFFSGDCFDAYHVLGAHPWQGDRGEEGWYDYEELARELIPWLLEHHFTHVEQIGRAHV